MLYKWFVRGSYFRAVHVLAFCEFVASWALGCFQGGLIAFDLGYLGCIVGGIFAGFLLYLVLQKTLYSDRQWPLVHS